MQGPKKAIIYGGLYGFRIVTDDEIEMLQNITYLYAAIRYRSGGDREQLSGNLVTTLAFYLKYGFNKQAKSMIIAYLSLDFDKNGNKIDEKDAINKINGYNKKLTDRGYLIDSRASERTKIVCQDLREMRQQYINDGSSANNRILNISLNFKMKTTDGRQEH